MKRAAQVTLWLVGVLVIAVITASFSTADDSGNDALSEVGPRNGASPLSPDLKFEPQWRDQGDCGPLCLYLLMRLKGHTVSVQDVKESLHYDPVVGCSLADVARAAEKLGFPVEIRFVNPRELPEVGRPFIAHVGGSLERGIGHFLVIIDYSRELSQYTAIDTTYQRLRAQTEGSLLAGYSGYVLTPKYGSAGEKSPYVMAIGLTAAGWGTVITMLLVRILRRPGEREQDGVLR